MENRAVDGEKGTGTKGRGQTFLGEGAELTFSTASRCQVHFCTATWITSFEYQLQVNGISQNSHTRDRKRAYYGAHFITTNDLAADRTRVFCTEPPSGNLKNTPSTHARACQNAFRTFLFQKNKSTKRGKESVHE